MSLQGMNHFTVLSDNLEETRKFYCDLLGFEEGPRPNFRFPGYWLYVGDQPILYVIHRDKLNEVRAGPDAKHKAADETERERRHLANRHHVTSTSMSGRFWKRPAEHGNSRGVPVR